jgi:hypothetical protein
MVKYHVGQPMKIDVLQVNENLRFRKNLRIREMTQTYPDWLRLAYNPETGYVGISGSPKNSSSMAGFNVQFY